MSVTFSVDDVASLDHDFEARPLSTVCNDALAFGGEGSWNVVDHGGTHALLGAVHLAFAKHRVLELSPDAIWLTIAEGFAQHIRLNAEELRARLVRHEGKERLTVTWSAAMPTDEASWTEVVSQFRGLLSERIGDGPAALFECDFSTSSQVDLTASQVVLMDAYSPYFDYAMMCICGIPKIRLTGTPDDWRKIRERVDVIAEFGLPNWCASLRRITDEFVAAAEGKASRAFFKRIYKPADAYGGELITGWIARLYPYLEGTGALDVPNPLLDVAFGKEADKKKHTAPGPGWHTGVGVRSSSVPASGSKARVAVKDIDGSHRDMVLFGGVRVVTEALDGALAPRATWELHEETAPPIDELLSEIERDHEVALRTSEPTFPSEGAAEVRQLRARFEQMAIRVGDATWRLAAEDERKEVAMPNDARSSLGTVLLRRDSDTPYGPVIIGIEGWRLQGEGLYLLCELEDEAGQRSWLDKVRRIRNREGMLKASRIVPVAGSLGELLKRMLNGEEPTSMISIGELRTFLR